MLVSIWLTRIAQDFGSWRLSTHMQRTLAITWPQSVLGEEDRLAVAAQVHGGVS
jgi:hypothetical protein